MSDPLGFKQHLLEGAGMSIYILFLDIYLLHNPPSGMDFWDMP